MAERINWGAEHLRLTTFQEGPVPPGAWKLVFGEEPESSTRNNRAQATEESGVVDPHTVKHISTPGREDWLVTSATVSNTGLPESFPFADGLAVLNRIVEQWLTQVNPTPFRLAFGAILMDAPAKDRVDGYERLAAFIKDVKLDPRSEDFTYQINWPRMSKTTPIKVNRLSKWSVAASMSQTFAVLSANRITMSHQQPMTFQVRAELDLSTDAAQQAPLPAEHIKGLWSELTVLGTEISREGNIP